MLLAERKGIPGAAHVLSLGRKAWEWGWIWPLAGQPGILGSRLSVRKLTFFPARVPNLMWHCLPWYFKFSLQISQFPVCSLSLYSHFRGRSTPCPPREVSQPRSCKENSLFWACHILFLSLVWVSVSHWGLANIIFRAQAAQVESVTAMLMVQYMAKMRWNDEKRISCGQIVLECFGAFSVAANGNFRDSPRPLFENPSQRLKRFLNQTRQKRRASKTR